MESIAIQLAAAFLGGIATAFTPCVYPLIPVTIGVLGRKPARSSFLFVLGLAVVYTALGMAAALTGRLLGFTQRPFVVFGVSLVFLLMGLGMLGLFEFRLPARANAWLAKRGGSGGIGALALGGASGLLAAPCAGPVLVGILAYVAAKSNPLFGVVLLLAFSVGMGMPFLLLGVFSQRLLALPRSGVWMEWVKHLAGIALVAAAFLFARPFLRTVDFHLLLLLSGVIVIAFLKELFPGEAPGAGRFRRGLLGVALIFTGWVFVAAVRENAFVEPAGKYREAAIPWAVSEAAGLRMASESGKPALVDFWAEWCTTCRELEERTLADRSVQEMIRNDFVPIRIDVTAPDETSSALTEKYRVMALPTIRFVDSRGTIIGAVSVTRVIGPAEFRALLERVKSGLDENGVCRSC